MKTLCLMLNRFNFFLDFRLLNLKINYNGQIGKEKVDLENRKRESNDEGTFS